jgi:ABC-type Mn2+/Zn2+ transport system ATPase subunit
VGDSIGGVVVGELVLELGGVWKGFDRGGRQWVPVLEDVSLMVAAGEIVVVVGTRDQGKTTLLNIASGVEPPDSGSVRVGGLELKDLRDRKLSRVLRTEISLAARDGPGMRMRMRDYVGLQLAAGRWWRRRERLSRRERRLRVGGSLDRLGVAECADLRWGELSDWQRVRVELAQAIAPRPRLLLVDDLLHGIGFGKTQEANQLLRELADEIRCGVLMAVSDHTSAAPADRVWHFDRRKLVLMADHTIPELAHIHQQRRTEQTMRARRRR